MFCASSALTVWDRDLRQFLPHRAERTSQCDKGWWWCTFCSLFLLLLEWLWVLSCGIWGLFFSVGSSLAAAACTEGATGGSKRVSATCLCQCSGVGALCAGWRRVLCHPDLQSWGRSWFQRKLPSWNVLSVLERAARLPWHIPVMIWAAGLSIWHPDVQDAQGSHPHSLSEILVSKVFAVGDICSFSSVVSGGGDCVFPTQATLSCRMFPGELLSPWERWSWHKNQVALFSENTSWGLRVWPEPLCDPCGKQGMSGGLCCPSTG